MSACKRNIISCLRPLARRRRGIEAAKSKGVDKGRPATIDAAKVRELRD